MGTYLNPNNESFLKLVNSGKYVDKTGLIDLLNHRIDIPDDNFICINRPRRFGKSIAEDMIVVAGVKLPKNAGEKFPLLGI